MRTIGALIGVILILSTAKACQSNQSTTPTETQPTAEELNAKPTQIKEQEQKEAEGKSTRQLNEAAENVEKATRKIKEEEG